MNVFEDCGSTKCGAIWYQLWAKTFDHNIISIDMIKPKYGWSGAFQRTL